MRFRPLAAILVVAVTLIASACGGDDGSPAQLSELAGAGAPSGGERAPDFSMSFFDGGTFSLSQHVADDGRPVFLNLWASWCGPCRAEMPDIDAAAAGHPDVAFIGVAVQDVHDKAREFADEIAVTYPLGFDESGEVDAGYSPIGLPASYIISSEGLILERIFGPLTLDQIDAKLADHF